jgi:hypothetical protein
VATRRPLNESLEFTLMEMINGAPTRLVALSRTPGASAVSRRSTDYATASVSAIPFACSAL